MINPARFLKKCLTNRPEALKSAKLASRKLYGQCYWFLKPNNALPFRLPNDQVLWLERDHSFTGCFWPGVDQYEPDVQAMLKLLLKKGDTFIDCGANIGFFSLLAAGIVGSSGNVISIEANPITFDLLVNNLKATQCGRAIHCALTSSSGELELIVPAKGDVYSSLRKGTLMIGEQTRKFKVAGRTLDDVVQDLTISKVDVIKIDVEGGELDVLRSSTWLMSTFRPFIITEYGTNTWPSTFSR